MPKYSDKKKEGESKPNYYDSNESRTDQESKEGLKTTVNDTAPGTRYQNKQQIQPVDEVLKDSKVPTNGFVKKEVKTPGSQLKQEVASRVAVSDGDFGGAANFDVSNPGSVGLKTLSYSGDAGALLGSAANTPVVSSNQDQRREGRFEKKLDQINKRINFAPSEQVIEEYSNPPYLGENSEEPQGYYGTPKNVSARSQKSTGVYPADPLFQRSADEITEDLLVSIGGQYVRRESVNYELEPTQASNFDPSTGEREATEYSLKYGNYVAKSMQVSLTKDDTGLYVSRVEFEVDDISCEDKQDNVVNAASSALIREMNRCELARQNIDSKAGRETQLDWSPLGRAVLNPSQTVALLAKIEAETGARIACSYKFANKAFAYQLNKAAKDGQVLHRPLREMLLGDICSGLTSAEFSEAGSPISNVNPFSQAAYRAGAPSIMIAVNDSIGKYVTKADVLTQPKGLRQYFQIADNNMDVFRLPKEFGAVLNAVDVFSTIDRGYDPLSPVCLTDRLGLISTINPNEYVAFSRSSATSDKVYKGSGPFTYAYSDRSSNYVITVNHPFYEGILQWINNHIAKLYDLLGGNGNTQATVKWNIPMHSGTKSFTTWDFLTLAAVPFMQKDRINSLRDVLDFEGNFEYPFNWLLPIKDYNPMNAVNYAITDHDSPLVSRQMIPSVAIRWTMPEFFWGVSTVGSGANKKPQYVSPWYFSELMFHPSGLEQGSGANKVNNLGFVRNDHGDAMTFPIIRSGVRLGYLDDLYQMEGRDVRLCLDRLVDSILPDANRDASTYAVYKYSQSSDGIPVISGALTLLDYLSAPRELGYVFPIPGGYLRMRDNLTANQSRLGLRDIAIAGETVQRTVLGLSDAYVGETSYRLYTWFGRTSRDTDILAPTGVNIARSQAFKQYWNCSPAVRMSNDPTDVATYVLRPDMGFFISMREMGNFGNANQVNLRRNMGYFKPFTTGRNLKGRTGGQQVNSPAIEAEPNYPGLSNLRVIAFAKGLWGRIQKLPMAISPWDTCDFDPDTGINANYDPYDFAAMFGMAGTMASEYNEDVYNREQQVQNQGYLYVEDPFIMASPLFKDAIKFTM